MAPAQYAAMRCTRVSPFTVPLLRSIGWLITGFWQAVLANLAKRWIDQIRWERQVRRGIDALMALDERMLHDIGLTRGAVEYAARYGRLPTRLSNQGCRQISPAAENPEEYPTGRMPFVRAEGHSAVRALLIAHGICRALPCRAESPTEGQCPAVPSEGKHPPRRACSMPRAHGRFLALLPSGGSVNGEAPQMNCLTLKFRFKSET